MRICGHTYKTVIIEPETDTVNVISSLEERKELTIQVA